MSHPTDAAPDRIDTAAIERRIAELRANDDHRLRHLQGFAADTADKLELLLRECQRLRRGKTH